MTSPSTEPDSSRDASALQRDVGPVAWMAMRFGIPAQATTDEPTAIRWRKAGGEVVPLYADEPVRKMIADAWVCGYYDAGYTHDSAYAYARADEHAAAALGPNVRANPAAKPSGA